MIFLPHGDCVSEPFPFLKEVSCKALSLAAVQTRRLVVQSTKFPPGTVLSLKDENLIHPVRELRAFSGGSVTGAAALAPRAVGNIFNFHGTAVDKNAFV